MQGLEVQAVVCDNQATPLLHKWGELDGRRVILDLLTEVDQATVVKCSFRCAQPSAYLHSSRQGWLWLDTSIIGRCTMRVTDLSLGLDACALNALHCRHQQTDVS